MESIDLFLYAQAFIAAVGGGILFTIIGIIPGTDETATMAPITLILVLMGLPGPVLFAWFIGIIVAMQISHTVPTAMAALPGSTMAVPMVLYSSLAKRLGIPHVAMRKMAAGSMIGTICALPVSLAFALLLAPIGQKISPYIGLVFTIGTVIVAYLSSAKWAAIIAIIPFAFLIQGFQRLAVEGVGHTLFISIFMGITIGPMVSEIFTVFTPKLRDELGRDKPNEIWLAPDAKSGGLIPNPFKLVTPKQARQVALYSSIGACTFTFSPVGMTVMLGEIAGGRCKELYQKITSALSVQDGVSNSTYIGEFIIPLVALAGLPLSAVAAGPGASLFNAPPRFSVEPLNNLAQLLSLSDYIVFGIIGIIGGALFAFPISVKKARSWTEIMFRKISHEALIGAFLGLIFMLAFYEAGLLGIMIALAIGIFGGFLHNRFGVHTGVQFMGYYASAWLVAQILSVAAKII
ncbi:MAG: tripartite tricarboxylate transporter permease [Synergistaceae bacterium]|jgi:hypothetical protein|nr:tripartite tricarboxylate transporter permease [Synergistaceae bacterium]